MKNRERIIEENEYLLELWHRSKAGDNNAFCQLAETLYRSLFNYATNFTDDREFIKDTLQELLLHIWEKRQGIYIQYVSIYFLKSLRNQILQEFRKNKPDFAMLDLHEIRQLTDYETVETKIEKTENDSESYQKLRKAIYELPKRQQEAIFLKFYEGLDNEQIAELMHVNRQSVANLIFKALTTLKTQIPFLSHWVLCCILFSY